MNTQEITKTRKARNQARKMIALKNKSFKFRLNAMLACDSNKGQIWS